MQTKNSDPRNWLLHRLYAKEISETVSQNVSGRLLDVGCGNQPYKDILSVRAERGYFGIDLSPTGDVVADALALPFADRTFDTVVSFEVMEHIPEPQTFLCEIRRVLKPSGKAVITTPFLWGEHNDPYDFYRYTRYGLRYLAEKAGFRVIAIEPRSGFWLLIALRMNYYLSRARTKLLYPVFWLLQVFAFCLDKLDKRYKRRDTVGFLTIIENIENRNRV